MSIVSLSPVRLCLRSRERSTCLMAIEVTGVLKNHICQPIAKYKNKFSASDITVHMKLPWERDV